MEGTVYGERPNNYCFPTGGLTVTVVCSERFVSEIYCTNSGHSFGNRRNGEMLTPDQSWPVLLINFRRPELTRSVLEEIIAWGPSKVYFFSDGPRTREDIPAVEKVRDIARAASSRVELEEFFSSENLGCRRGVEAAIDWLFSREQGGIILEDDCLPTRDFFKFTNSLLTAYRDERRVWMIAGSTPISASRFFRRGETTHTLDMIGETWGWATWRRAWEAYDRNLLLMDSAVSLARFEYYVLKAPETLRRIRTGYQQVKADAVDTWDYQWALTRIANDGLTVVPPENLVLNVGFGRGATHTTTRPIGLNRKMGSFPEHEHFVPINGLQPNWAYRSAIERRERWLAIARKLSRSFRATRTSIIDPVYLGIRKTLIHKVRKPGSPT